MLEASFELAPYLDLTQEGKTAYRRRVNGIIALE